MDPTELALGEGVGVFLKYSYTTHPVMAAKVRDQAIPRTGGPRTDGEGAGEFLSQLQKSHIVHLGLVLRLTDRQTAPFDCGFHPVHALAVFRH